MRIAIATFTALLLAPAPAFACLWTPVPGDPLDVLWAALPLYCVAGVVYRHVVKSPNPKSLVPVALAVGCLVAAAAMGAFLGTDNWQFSLSVIAAPVCLLIAVLSTYRVASRRHFVALSVAMFLFGCAMLGAVGTHRVNAIRPVNHPAAAGIVF